MQVDTSCGKLWWQAAVTISDGMRSWQVTKGVDNSGKRSIIAVRLKMMIMYVVCVCVCVKDKLYIR